MIFDEQRTNQDNVSDFHAKRSYVKKSLSEIIYDDLKSRILNCEISKEDRLMDKNLAEYYQTSRTPIRDALARLENENIIKKLDYGGYVVRELEQKDIEEIFGIRAVLESYAASLATQRITKNELKEMGKIIQKSKKALEKKDFDEFIELNTMFHGCLYKASKSRYLLKILEKLWDHFYRYRKVILQTERNLEDSIRDHEILLEKMSQGDHLSIESIVKEHVNRALEAFKSESKKGI